MHIRVIADSISPKELAVMAESLFGSFVKAVVDVSREVMAVGGELHADEEAILLSQGSQQENLWGINIYPKNVAESLIEFNSMINVRPSRGNYSRSVENKDLQDKIRAVVKKLVV